MRPSSTPSPSSASSSRLTDEAPPLKRRRYSCRLRVSSSDFESGDDTVDLVTEEIVKNSLRAPTLCKFPRYEDEDDVDELDALTGPEEPLVHLNQTVILPPVLEAERRRRDECSDEEADENDDVNEVPSIGSHRAAAEDSEDELGIWGSLDESNSVSSIGNPAGNTSSHSQLAHPNVTAVTALQSRKSPRSTKIPSLHLSPVLPTHLPTPPQSDTPTFTDELLTPVTLVSPPSSPSPTKSKPKLGFEHPRVSKSRLRAVAVSARRDLW
ncbi:hypothetical protein C8R46DRAFT_1214329 [Mycena filopes]|nr:hypothetical protein C8R46DRAFT_1214329 [Mycena filopes]